MNYWINKDERAKKAVAHTKEMETNFYKEIRDSIANTVVYNPNTKFNVIETTNTPYVIFLNEDSVSAVLHYKHCCVLNFASYKHPGGAFINGSSAQEESLCHESFLYNVLKEKQDYYEWNNNYKNKALYLNRALYSPNVLFKRDNKSTYADVLTCAAPNYSTARQYRGVTKEENYRVLRDRIQFIKYICEDQKVDTLIAGAFGCGVFKQDPKEVAQCFKDLFAHSTIKTIVYAVPGTDRNYQVFKEFFDTEEEL